MSKMKTITTNYEKQLFWKEDTMDITSVEDCMHVFNVYPEVTGETMNGFGGAFTEASAHNYAKLGKENQKNVIEGYFGDTGLRYNLGRVTIHSCDFGLGNYTYIEEGDESLDTFSIEHDTKEILPMIQEAMQVSKNQISFLASPWSPPAFMKTNQEMNHGGKLVKEYYQAWANYFVEFIKAYQAAGIDISYVTVQNEPEATQAWDSCLYSAKEEGDFVREYLGPTLEKAGLSHIRIFIWDHNKESVYDRAKITLEDGNTKKYVSGIAVHWYTGDHFEAIDLVKKVYPEMDIYFTEGCVEYTRFADSGEVQKAEMYAHDMIGNFNAGLNGFIDWNLLLDEKGGPNHVGNYCAAPMMCEGATDSLEKRLSYYYIGQFSRYIKPGAKRIYVTRYTDKVEAVGFLNPDGEKVIVLLNKTQGEVEVTLRDKGQGNYVKIAAHSIMTVLYN